MKLFTNFKLKHERLFKAINLDWREVSVELMNDLIEEQQSHFASRQEIFDLKRQLAVYEAKEQLNQKGE
jgi:hypothetical protein|nr:MAG TPA: hypothetical protein [Caudoviricetes sp.]